MPLSRGVKSVRWRSTTRVSVLSVNLESHSFSNLCSGPYSRRHSRPLLFSVLILHTTSVTSCSAEGLHTGVTSCFSRVVFTTTSENQTRYLNPLLFISLCDYRRKLQGSVKSSCTLPSVSIHQDSGRSTRKESFHCCILWQQKGPDSRAALLHQREDARC